MLGDLLHPEATQPRASGNQDREIRQREHASLNPESSYCPRGEVFRTRTLHLGNIYAAYIFCDDSLLLSPWFCVKSALRSNIEREFCKYILQLCKGRTAPAAMLPPTSLSWERTPGGVRAKVEPQVGPRMPSHLGTLLSDFQPRGVLHFALVTLPLPLHSFPPILVHPQGQ